MIGQGGAIGCLVILASSWLPGLPALPDATIAASAGLTPPGVASYVRTRGDGFEVVSAGVARPIVFRGVNLGAGAPGHFPGEFAFTKDDYRRYLRFAHELRANAIRIYALHPPSFYEALREENESHPDQPLWIFQGVWTELPASNDFWEDGFTAGYEDELRLAVDAIHGNAEVAPRAGHASGRYASDVSPWLAGWLLGREWEPYAVRETQGRHPDSTRFRGAYLAVENGTAMETWLARVCDTAAEHERSRYGVAHTVSFVSWPTLDVIRHPTESEPGGAELEHDEDAYSVDPRRIRLLSDAGIDSGCLGYFATYHVYPYYPDFINLDPAYTAIRDRHGACNYAGYLRDLKAQTRGLPLLIGEYGVATSRGISHLQPQGIHDGGDSEGRQGEHLVRLLEDIEDSGCGGSLLFAVFDEWFKNSWLILRTDHTASRDPLWHDLLDDEEGYGLIAFDPPSRIRIDGDVSDWRGIAPYAEASHARGARQTQGTPLGSDPGGRRTSSGDIGPVVRALYITSDAARVYLRLDVEPRALRGRAQAIGVALDVLDPRRGDAKLPAPLDATWSRGAEYVLVIEPGRDRHAADARAELFIDRQMNWSEFSCIAEGDTFAQNLSPLRTAANDDGRYASLVIITNRERISREGVVYPARHLDSGRLVRGREPAPPRSAPGGMGGAYDPHAEWWLNRARGVIEIALPWGLLNVGDPSSRAVLDDRPETAEVECDTTQGIGLLAWATRAPGFRADSLGPTRAGFPSAGQGECQFLGPAGTRQVVVGEHVHVTSPDSAIYSWNGWDRPITHERVKASADFVRRALQEMDSRGSQASRGFEASHQGRRTRGRPRPRARRAGARRERARSRGPRPGHVAGNPAHRRGPAAR